MESTRKYYSLLPYSVYLLNNTSVQITRKKNHSYCRLLCICGITSEHKSPEKWFTYTQIIICAPLEWYLCADHSNVLCCYPMCIFRIIPKWMWWWNVIFWWELIPVLEKNTLNKVNLECHLVCILIITPENSIFCCHLICIWRLTLVFRSPGKGMTESKNK